ncbi:hypothetical protein J4227_04080 [Candidatus Woesearchaeota archaeon]|nr:hypothetical protein [Candidatus Woesearchaeota archaeon]
MTNQFCPKCGWEQKADDEKAYMICPECGFDAQDMLPPYDVLPFSHPLRNKIKVRSNP